jgi:hypothetical protein
MVVGIIRGVEAILAAPHVWFNTLTVCSSDRYWALFCAFSPKIYKKFEGFYNLPQACLGACLQRASLSSSRLSVRMSTEAFIIFITSLCAHVYKGLHYLHHANLCACLQRPSLSSSCLSVRMSTKAFIIFIKTICEKVKTHVKNQQKE